ncbi:MAG: glycosyltransferase [Bacteroidota bacterium]
MKILQLCHKVPFPPKDGGCIAINNLTTGLINEGHQVKVLAINTPKHFTDIQALPADYRNKTNIEAVFIDTDVKILPAFLNLFTDRSYNIERFYSRLFEQKLIDVLSKERFDIVQLESLYTSMYVQTIRKHSKAKIVLRSHNIEHQIWERTTNSTANFLKKWYLNLLTGRLKKYELNSLTAFDAIASITEGDSAYLKKQGVIYPIDTFPFGIDLQHITSKSKPEECISVFHIGAMDWAPNVEGIKWFLKYSWPKLQIKHPDLKLYLAGRNMPAELNTIAIKNVIVEGEVADSHTFMNSKGIMIVPLLSGGGMRVKIIEGMALGKTIVSTSIGAEGIDCTNNTNIVIADDPINFAEAISNCILDKTFFETIGNNAKNLAVQKYNNIDICNRLSNFYHQLIK